MSFSSICAASKFNSTVMAVYIVEVLTTSCTFMFVPNIFNNTARALSCSNVPIFVFLPQSQKKKKKISQSR
jgi:hypothetical protein